MSAVPGSLDSARLDRALDRLADHCESVGQMTRALEERRPVVRARLEAELGPDLTRVLLAGLCAAS